MTSLYNFLSEISFTTFNLDSLLPLIIETNADINLCKDMYDRLLIEVFNTKEDIEMLIPYGLDINEKYMFINPNEENYIGYYDYEPAQNSLTTPLIRAAINCDDEVVQFLLENGALTEIQDDDGRTALMSLIIERDVDILNNTAKLLIENSSSLNTQDNDGNTALMIYCYEICDTDIFKFMIENGASTSITNNKGENVLNISYNTGDINLIEFFIQKYNISFSIKDNFNILLEALLRNDIDQFKRLIENCTKSIIEVDNKYGETMLMIACRKNKPEIVKILIENGASLDMKNNRQETALNIACTHNNTEIASLLIEKGALLSIKNNKQETPLIICTRNNNVDLVKLLLEKGASTSIKNSRKETALDIAKKNKFTNLIQLLSKYNN